MFDDCLKDLKDLKEMFERNRIELKAQISILTIKKNQLETFLNFKKNAKTKF